MNESSLLEILILGAILAFCLWYFYRSIKNLFFPKEGAGRCGGCSSSGSSCSPKESRVSLPQIDGKCK
jgi:hypothetical protein